MAFEFSGGAATDDIDFGSYILDQDTWTALFWVYPTVLATPDRFFHDDEGASTLLFGDGLGNLRGIRSRQTAGTDYSTTDTPMTTNSWQFVVVTYDANGAATERFVFYVGDLATLAVKSAVAVANEGSGVLTSLNQGFFVANRSDAAAQNQGFTGNIAVVAFTDTLMTQEQIQAWQFFPRVSYGIDLYCQLGLHGIGTQPDLSGNNNDGTPQGVALADHVPLGPPFGFDQIGMGHLDSIIVDDIRLRDCVLPAAVYSKGDYATPPTADDDLETLFICPEYEYVSAEDGVYVIQTATDEHGIFQMKDPHVNNTDPISVTCKGKASLAPSSSPVILEVKNQYTGEWEELDREEAVGAGVTFTLTGSLS